MKKPYILFSWKQNCIQLLVSYLLEDICTNTKTLENYTILVPHDRVKRYIEDIFQKDTRFPSIAYMPTMYTLQEYTAHLAQNVLYKKENPRTILSLHEEIIVLQKVIVDNIDIFSSLYKSISQLDSKTQYSWLQESIGILNECFLHATIPQKIHYTEDCSPLVGATLKGIHLLYTKYTETLDAMEYTSPSYTVYRLAKACMGLDAEALCTLQDKTCILFAPSLLTGSENCIMKCLWEHTDTRIILYTDTGIQGDIFHRSTLLHKEWIHSWNAESTIFSYNNEETDYSMTIHESITVHSELEEVAKLCAETDKATAIVPLDSAVLLPLLHHVRAEEINVSIGYPFSYSSLAFLIELCIEAQENIHEGKYRTIDIMALIEQPNIERILKETVAEGECYKDILAILCPSLFQESYVDIKGMKELLLIQKEEGIYTQCIEAFSRCMEVCVIGIERMRTYKDIAHFLEALARLMSCIPMESISLLEKACMERLYTKGFQQFMNSIEYNTEWITHSIFHALRSYIQTERVPFVGFPITTVQIIGLLEIQCIPFENIILVEALEGNVPHTNEESPLLPNFVRTNYLGLPSIHNAVYQEAYYFFCAMNSARHVDILYHTSSASGVDASSVRSRFVEECIWEWEKKHKTLIMESEIVRSVGLPEITPLIYCDAREKTKAIQEAIEERLQIGISATLLRSYLECPFAFLQQYIYCIPPVEEYRKGISPLAIGNAIHSVLEDIVLPYKGKTLCKEDFHAQQDSISHRIYTLLEEEYPLTMEEKIMLLHTIPRHIAFFVEAQPNEWYVESIEEKYRATISGYPLQGKIDRLDRRENGLHIVDYKTGKSKKYSKKILHSMLESSTVYTAKEYMEYIRKADIQAFVYVYLIHNQYLCTDINASYYYIGEKASSTMEVCLFNKESREEQVHSIEDHIPRVLSLVIDDMVQNPFIECIRGEQCRYCGYSTLCI